MKALGITGFAHPKKRDNLSAWAVGGGTLAFNTGISPIGIGSIHRFVEDSSTGNHAMQLTTPVLTNGVPYVFEVFVKLSGRQYCAIGHAGGVRFFDLSGAGALGATSGTILDSKITSVGDGWYLCQIQLTGAGATAVFNLLMIAVNGTDTYTGGGVSNMSVWLPRVRQGALTAGFTTVPGDGGGSGNVTYIQALDFESASNTFAGLNVEAISGGLTRNTSIVRHGVASAKFYINRADVGFGGGQNPHRAEIHSLEDEYEFNQDYWFGFSQYYQNWTSDPAAEQIWQFHNVPNFGAGETWGTLKLQTPFGCQVQNNRFLIKHAVSNTPSNPNSSVTVSSIDIGAVTSNAWVDWVIHARFHYSTGLIEVWKDGELVYTKTGNTYYNDENGPYHKMGIYKWSWVHPQDNSIVDERTMYVDDWRIAVGSDVVYSDVAPRSNA